MSTFQDLTAPFALAEVRWVILRISGRRALVAPYVDARAIMDRLDAVFTPAGWQDSYQVLPDGAVQCKLSVLFRVESSDWVTKSDVGGAPDRNKDRAFLWPFRRRRASGDQVKAACSDALKRTAVKLGIGRYLYKIAPVWVDYDPATGDLLQTPKLADWALPAEPSADQPPGQ
jgi:hypothetical protein